MSQPLETGPQPRRLNPWHFALMACFLLAALLGTRFLYDSDLGYHLKGGQWIIQHHQVPDKDTYTYTVSGHDYLDIQWLYQVLLYTAYQWGGYALLSALTAGFVLLLIFLTWKRLRLTDAPLWMCVILLALVLLGIENRFLTRPETLSCILLSLTLWILESRARGGKDRLYLLPAIFALWANLEGLFAVGWAVVGIFILGWLFRPGGVKPKTILYCLLTVPVCLLNPYGWRGLVFPFTLLMTIDSGVFHQAIREFHSPWEFGSEPWSAPATFLLIYKLFSLLLLSALLATGRSRKIHEWLLVAAFFTLSCAAMRNIQLYLLVCAPLAATCWKEFRWDGLRKFQGAVLGRPLAAWALGLILLGLGLRVVTGAYYISERRPERFGLGLKQDFAQAVDFLNRNRLDGRILNHLNAGGWLDWQGPQKTFMDGRLEVMGEKFLSELLKTKVAGNFHPLIDKYQPDILLFNPQETTTWLKDLQDMPDWRPVYLDGSSVIYLRRSYRDDLVGLDDGRILAASGIPGDTLDRAMEILGTPREGAIPAFWRGFVTAPVDPSGLNSMAIFCTFTGHLKAAETLNLEAVRQSRGRYLEFYFNLKYLYAATDQRDKEFLCEERIGRSIPDSTHYEISVPVGPR